MAATAPRGGVAPNTRRVMNLAHFLRKNARRLPDAAGLVQGGRVWSWGELDARVDAMAAALAGRGVVKGDRVLVQSRNGHQLFESMFVCFRLGAVWVPTNYRQTPAEVAYLAKASGARALICGSVFPEHAAAIRAECPDLDVVVEIGGASFGEDYDGLVAAHDGQAAPVADVEHDDPCWFFFTSGTTGRPKAAVLTHGQMGFVITNHLCDLMPGTTEADASLVVAPLSHGAGIHQLAQVAAGATTVLTAGERLDPEEAWSLVAQWRVANMFTVPTIVKILTEHPAVERHDRSSLRHVIYAGAPMYREDQKRALRALGPVLVQYFGLGEVTGNITVLPPRLHAAEDGPGVKVGTCGFERTGMQVDIQDPEGRSLPPGQTGEICVCGPAVFAGYYDNPKANAEAFRNGWFRTGDLGHLDGQGFLFITGRASDMYISGGSNVYPRETEEKLLKHPAIAEAAILGVPDPTWGEVGVAVCTLRPGETVEEPALIAWLSAEVARYKLPKRVFFWDELPKSGYGKITKRAIREGLEQRGALPLDGKR
ncbi:acyl-CoA synthetase [Methylobacterium aerolatum]|uniref:Acyl-CoA synthetase (AMP-forming)/AMP-acid ligase II n=1 Tax=Methylobacterium aerolatum TaxID=418708 RepID=A0ABU0HX59_9HYPH|nr:acyl-CoA synthetase [Methylobacterium aerolatum]MDQ0446932.1 acyl-CoA synthetase (AMP-forming)/AMP-acid ligase II [Methylobacterium aerolatum]GJD35168.1 Long-chain-fatty-acid--CoA ligase [Methylobacterium aerolatum]